MPMNKLKEKNNSIKALQQKLKQSPGRTYQDINNILTTVADRNAFILLMDTFETEKEITRDLLECLIDHSYEIHLGMIEYMEDEINLSKGFKDIFSTENLKSIIIFAISVGIVLSIASNEKMAGRVIDIFFPSSVSKKSTEGVE